MTNIEYIRSEWARSSLAELTTREHLDNIIKLVPLYSEMKPDAKARQAVDIYMDILEYMNERAAE